MYLSFCRWQCFNLFPVDFPRWVFLENMRITDSNWRKPLSCGYERIKYKVALRAKEAHTAGAYPCFSSMKQLRVLLLPPGRDASPSQGYPRAVCQRYPSPGWRETMWGKVSCLKKQHDDRDWALNQQPSDLKSNALTATPPCPHSCGYRGWEILQDVCFFATILHPTTLNKN